VKMSLRNAEDEARADAEEICVRYRRDRGGSVDERAADGLHVSVLDLDDTPIDMPVEGAIDSNEDGRFKL